MIINHNMGASNAIRQMGVNQTNANKSMEKLSSGLKINKAGDDAAGLAISEKMRGQIRGLDQASANAQDSISMIQTAEGALNETHSILQRMRELAVQAGNDTNTSNDREEIQKEVNQLTSEINRIGNTTEFNNQNLLNAESGVKVPAAPGTPAVEGTPAVDAKNASGTVGNINIEAKGDYAGDKGNIKVVISASSGATAGAAIADGTLTITLDSGATMDADAINTALTADSLNSSFTASGGSAVNDADEVTLTGGKDAQPEKPAVPAKEGTPAKSTFSMQVGANEGQTMTLEFSDMRANALGLTSTEEKAGFTDATDVTNEINGAENAVKERALDVTTAKNAGNAVTKIENAINTVSAERSKLGAYQNRLEHTINNLGTSSENLTSAESRIRDVNMAKEMANFSKNNILSQAAQAMVAQANNQPQQVLQLLR